MVTGNANEALIAAFREAQARKNEISKENRERILKYNEEGEGVAFNDIVTKILDDYERLKP